MKTERLPTVPCAGGKDPVKIGFNQKLQANFQDDLYCGVRYNRSDAY